MKTHQWILILALMVGAWNAAGQTAIDLTRQGRIGSGTTLPVECFVGEIFFKTDAPVGTNLYACLMNGWSVMGLTALGGDASGTQQSMTVKGIQGHGVSAAGPTDQNVLRWNATTAQWEPAMVPGTGAAAPSVTCTPGSLYLLSDPTNNIQQLYVCSRTNTWSMTSTGTGLAASRPVNCLVGQTWLSVDTGAMTYCSVTGNPGTWSALAGLGVNSNTILNGSGAPASGTGANGDFFLRTDTQCLYGPKASGAWLGTCVSLVGPPGSSLTPAWTTVSFSSTPTFAVTSPMQVFQIVLTGNVASSTIAGTSAEGQYVIFKICEDAIGGRTFVPPLGLVGFGTLDTTAGACNTQSFGYDANYNFVAITKMRTDSGNPQLSENNGLYPLPAAPQSIVGTNDARLGNARTPTTHASTHQNGGADEVASAVPGPNAIPKAGSGGTLAAGWIPPIASGTTIPAPNITGHPIIEGMTSTGASGAGKFLFDTNPTIAGHPTIEGVTSTGASGTGAIVFATSPTLVAPNIGAATATTINKVTLTPPATAASLAFGSNNSTWTFPAGGGTLGLGTVTSISGTANQIASTNGATPALSLSPTLALPGTVNKITLTAPTTAWTIQPAADNQTTIIPGGVLSTAAVTGSSVLKGSGGNAVAASAADVVTLFSSCSGTQYLGADGACHAAGGAGTVAVVGSGSLTSSALITGGGTQTLQTPSTTATMDLSGNISTPGSMTVGSGANTAGAIQLAQGIAPSAGTAAITLYAPTSVTSYKVAFPGAAASGIPHWSNASGTVTETVSALTVSDIPPADFSTGPSKTFSLSSGYFECTGTCTITMPSPAAGMQFCVRNANSVNTVITFAALGGSGSYENTASTAYGTAGTGTLVSGGAAGDKMCLVGKDSTHYDVFSFAGTWTAN